MKIAFRADASLDIGSGHVMRCLTLADALRERGAQCHFLCREHPGHLNTLIRARGHGVQPLGAPEGRTLPPGADRLAHAAWLGATQADDAAECADTLGRWQPDWLVVDHYALDAEWESAVRPLARQLMVIDDLADREHDCDLLLDVNLGRNADDYSSLIRSPCKLMVGPRFALLRPEFSMWRNWSLQRRSTPRLQHLLIAMGGVDRDNVSGKLLSGIASTPLAQTLSITIVLGSNAPHLQTVREQAAAMSHPIAVLSGADNMAHLMSLSDLAIGAAGGMAWERCCLGLPSMNLILAANQTEGAQALAATSAALLANTTEQAVQALLQLARNEDSTKGATLQSLSAAAQQITDGLGASRVADTMTPQRSLRPKVRPMRTADLDDVLSWRNHPDVRRFMLTQHAITSEEHHAWFEKVSTDSTRVLLIVEEGDTPLGFVQFTHVDQFDAANWGFYAVPNAPKGSGKKLGRAALDHAFKVLNVRKVCGQALESNHASIALHLALGFQEESVLHEQHLVQEQKQHLLCFGLLASEWRTLNHPES